MPLLSSAPVAKRSWRFERLWNFSFELLMEVLVTFPLPLVKVVTVQTSWVSHTVTVSGLSG